SDVCSSDLEGVDDRQIARTGDAVEVGLPNCHGDNIQLDPKTMSRQYSYCRYIVWLTSMLSEDCMHTILRTERLPGGMSAPVERESARASRAWAVLRDLVTW